MRDRDVEDERKLREWPTYKMARDLANGKVFPVSEEVIKQTARKYGIGRKMGRAIVFNIQDCDRLYEALPCPSDSFVAPKALTGSFAVPSAESALKKALALTTRKSQKKSGQSVKQNSSPNQSTILGPRLRSRKRH
jgi:hypothetical protein